MVALGQPLRRHARIALLLLTRKSPAGFFPFTDLKIYISSVFNTRSTKWQNTAEPGCKMRAGRRDLRQPPV
jgi:hypothetical protein